MMTAQADHPVREYRFLSRRLFFPTIIPLGPKCAYELLLWYQHISKWGWMYSPLNETSDMSHVYWIGINALCLNLGRTTQKSIVLEWHSTEVGINFGLENHRSYSLGLPYPVIHYHHVIEMNIERHLKLTDEPAGQNVHRCPRLSERVYHHSSSTALYAAKVNLWTTFWGCTFVIICIEDHLSLMHSSILKFINILFHLSPVSFTVSRVSIFQLCRISLLHTSMINLASISSLRTASEQ